MDDKQCRVCEEELPLYKFHRKKDSRDGYATICKDCLREKQGHTKRTPKARDERTDVTMDLLLEDAFTEAERYPHDWRIRRIVKKLRSNPYSHDDEVSDFLYEMWERRMKASVDFDDLNTNAPVVNRRTEYRHQKRNTSITLHEEWETI